MRYYAQYDNFGTLTGIGTGSGGTEITKAEYDRLLVEIRAKAAHVEAVYADPLAIDKVPQEWRDEILQRVQERREMEPKPTDEVDAEELADAVEAIL